MAIKKITTKSIQHFPNFRQILKNKITEKDTDIAKVARSAGIGYASAYNFIRKGSNISLLNLTKIFEALERM